MYEIQVNLTSTAYPTALVSCSHFILGNPQSHLCPYHLFQKQEAFEKCWAHLPLRAVLHCHSPGVATVAVARCLRIDVHDNAWQRGPLWPHGMGPIKRWAFLRHIVLNKIMIMFNNVFQTLYSVYVVMYYKSWHIASSVLCVELYGIIIENMKRKIKKFIK